MRSGCHIVGRVQAKQNHSAGICSLQGNKGSILIARAVDATADVILGATQTRFSASHPPLQDLGTPVQTYLFMAL